MTPASAASGSCCHAQALNLPTVSHAPKNETPWAEWNLGAQASKSTSFNKSAWAYKHSVLGRLNPFSCKIALPLCTFSHVCVSYWSSCATVTSAHLCSSEWHRSTWFLLLPPQTPSVLSFSGHIHLSTQIHFHSTQKLNWLGRNQLSQSQLSNPHCGTGWL